MTREELKTVKRGEFLYVPIITKHYGHSTGNRTIGNYDYPMYELFRLKVEDICVFDYNEFLITNGGGYIIESIEKSKTEALQRRKNLEEKGELEGFEKFIPLTPWWYGMKTLIVKFDLSKLDNDTQKLFDDTYREYRPTFFSDIDYYDHVLGNHMDVYEKYLSFPLTGRDGVVVNEDNFNDTYSYRALKLFSKTKKNGQNMVKNENREWLKYIDDEIEFLKKAKNDLIKISKKDGVLI